MGSLRFDGAVLCLTCGSSLCPLLLASSGFNVKGSGQFRINWGSNFPDTNYAIVGMSGGSSGSRGDDNTVTTGNRADHTVGFVDIRTRNFNNGNMTNAEVTGFIVVR